TKYRGRIVWFLITSRPDLIPIDLKRQGRAEEHLALFYPGSSAEYDELFRILLKKTGSRCAVSKLTELLDPSTKELSGADLEAILSRALLRSPEGSNEISPETLRAAFDDFLPATPRLEREYQILAAALECTSREILPADLQSRSTEQLHARMAEVRELLRDR